VIIYFPIETLVVHLSILSSSASVLTTECIVAKRCVLQQNYSSIAQLEKYSYISF